MANVTLKQLSELTGVSIRSVSRALQGKNGISADKREMVLAAAAGAGYTPNIQARNLRLQKNNFIGIVVPDYDFNENGYISSRKVNSLQLSLERKGYFTLFGVNTGKQEDLENLLRQWRGLVSTVIFFSWNMQWDQQKVLAGFSLPVIFIDIDTNYGHFLRIDRSQGIYDAMRYLSETGHTHLARCGNIPNRENGFNAALHDIQGPAIHHTHLAVFPDFQNGYAAGPFLMEKKADGVFFDTDRMAFGFLKYCGEHAIRIPEQVAVVGFDDEPWDLYSFPSLSTVAQPIEEINEAILDLLEHPREQFCSLSFKTRFIKRESI